MTGHLLVPQRESRGSSFRSRRAIRLYPSRPLPSPLFSSPIARPSTAAPPRGSARAFIPTSFALLRALSFTPIRNAPCAREQEGLNDHSIPRRTVSLIIARWFLSLSGEGRGIWKETIELRLKRCRRDRYTPRRGHPNTCAFVST